MTSTLNERIAAAQDFNGLCGLQWALAALWLGAVGVLPDQLWWLVIVPLLCGIAVRRYYRRVYGIRQGRAIDAGLVSAVWIFGILVLMIVVVAVPDGILDLAWPPVLAAALAALWWWSLRHVGTTWVHALGVLAIGGCGLIPVSGDTRLALTRFAAATALVTVGLYDHWRLTRILGKGLPA